MDSVSAIRVVGGGLHQFGFTVFFLPISQDLGISRAATSLAFSLSRAQGAMEAPLVGYLIDPYGPRPIIVTAVFLAGVGLHPPFLVGFAPDGIVCIKSYARFGEQPLCFRIGARAMSRACANHRPARRLSLISLSRAAFSGRRSSTGRALEWLMVIVPPAAGDGVARRPGAILHSAVPEAKPLGTEDSMQPATFGIDKPPRGNTFDLRHAQEGAIRWPVSTTWPPAMQASRGRCTNAEPSRAPARILHGPAPDVGSIELPVPDNPLFAMMMMLVRILAGLIIAVAMAGGPSPGRTKMVSRLRSAGITRPPSSFGHPSPSRATLRPRPTSARCTPRARACRRTMPRRRSGMSSPLDRVLPWPSTTSASSTPTARASPRTMPMAAKWYGYAAGQGNADAQYNLGHMLAQGEGIPPDYAKAAKWYRSAAEQGHAYAQNNLGTMYSKGRGVAQDYAEAAKWYRLSAEQGNAVAQLNLGVLYANGQGVQQNYVAAAMWLNLAAMQGNASAVENRDFVAAKMTPDQLAKAERLAREWKPKTQP